MKEQQLIKLKKRLSKLSDYERKQRDLYLRKLMRGEIYGPSHIGYASIDKPWAGNYPEELYMEHKKYNKIIDYIRETWSGYDEDVMIHYYGENITAKVFFERVEATARSLKSFNLEKGDTIVINLESVPEFIYLFFAAEIIGVNVKNKIGATATEIVEVINESNAKCYFTPDYTSKDDIDIVYGGTDLQNIVLISPLEYSNGDTSNLRPHIKQFIENKYSGAKSDDVRNINWKEFLLYGKNYTGELYVESDDDTKLFSAYTSGSTGDRKEVIHTSKTILEMLYQMIFSTQKADVRDKWLWPIYPPSLVAAIVAYLSMPLAQGRILILDPYFDYKDLDLEMMHYEPNSTGLVPLFLESLIESKRIPEDYDMSYLKVLGYGAESLPNKSISRIEGFLISHNCYAQLNGGYGNSEGGSEFTIAFSNDILRTRSSGFPLINTIVSVFEPGTERELSYGEIGELCKSGPGIMLGYANKEDTDKAIKTHVDGQKWLHTGDIGYITDNGFVFVLGREGIRVYSNKIVYPLEIENKISNLEGVKTAIIVSGDSKLHEKAQAPYLFIVPFENVDQNVFLSNIESELSKVLLECEMPEETHIIDSKPIVHFKVDKKVLRKNFGITTNNK